MESTSAKNETATAEERYREALNDARGYASASRSAAASPIRLRREIAGNLRATEHPVTAAAPAMERSAASSAATAISADELGPVLGSMKHNNRQKVEANAVLPKDELETAEEALRGLERS